MGKLKKIKFIEVLLTFVGTLIGIGSITYLGYHTEHFTLVAPPFGAAAVLFFAAPNAPLIQPKNTFFGHLIAVIVGTSTYYLLGTTWYSIALSVAIAILIMVLTGTTHPPGGATAFLCVMAGKDFSFILTIMVGTTILFCIAVAVNYFQPRYNYPDRK